MSAGMSTVSSKRRLALPSSCNHHTPRVRASSCPPRDHKSRRLLAADRPSRRTDQDARRPVAPERRPGRARAPCPRIDTKVALPRRCVLARRLAQFLGGRPRRPEDRRRSGRRGRDRAHRPTSAARMRFARLAQDGAGLAGEGDQRAGLQALQPGDRRSTCRRRWPSASRSSIWPPTMPACAGGLGELATRARSAPRDRHACPACASTSKASVSSASPARIAVASSNCLWQRRLAAPQIVVVHRRQIVVDQRIGVHEFDGGRHPAQRAAVDAEQPPALQHQERAQPLAAAQRRIAHGLDDAAPQDRPAAAAARRACSR